MEKIKVLFVHRSLVCGGAEQALFDLIHLLDKERFEASVFIQENDGEWITKFEESGIPVLQDFSARKATWNPVKKAGNIVRKLRTAQAYRRDGKGLLDACLAQKPDIVVAYNVWYNEEMVFVKGAKTVKVIHGDPGTNPDYRNEALNHREILSRYDRIICVSRFA